MTVEGPIPSHLDAGTAALAAGDWAAARDAFTSALTAEESPEALTGLGDALWWLGETHASVEHRERAYALYRKRGDAAPAVDIAFGLAVHYRANVGNEAAAAGWGARAKRLVAEAGLEEFRGWVMLFEAGEAPDPLEGERLARLALEIARATGDLDLELSALAQTGSLLVAQGRIDEGVALLDEAMAGSLGGEGGRLETVVFTSCNMIGSCTRCAEFERAVQWIRAADRFTKRYGCPFLYLYCRTHYGHILIATGDWTEAEAQLAIALKESVGSQLPMHLYASATLALLRLQQGRLEEAEDLIEGFDGQGPAAPVAAGIALRRGDPARALAIAELAAADADAVDGAPLHELAGEAEIALGRRDAAAARARALVGTGDATGCAVIGARGRRLLGRALGARDELRRALDELARIGLPYEVGRTRLALAETIRGDDADGAAAEARAALDAFEGLGASRDADEAAAFLRALGVKAARTGPKGLGTLTKREAEVLELVATGLANPEIAERLYLSRKTVEHHVASILSKLGLRNRAEATRAYAEGSLQR